MLRAQLISGQLQYLLRRGVCYVATLRLTKIHALAKCIYSIGILITHTCVCNQLSGPYSRMQAKKNKEEICALLGHYAVRVVITCRRFGTTYRPHLQWPRNPRQGITTPRCITCSKTASSSLARRKPEITQRTKKEGYRRISYSIITD
jgi:hypothetical protein